MILFVLSYHHFSNLCALCIVSAIPRYFCLRCAVIHMSVLFFLFFSTRDFLVFLLAYRST